MRQQRAVGFLCSTESLLTDDIFGPSWDVASESPILSPTAENHPTRRVARDSHGWFASNRKHQSADHDAGKTILQLGTVRHTFRDPSNRVFAVVG